MGSGVFSFVLAFAGLALLLLCLMTGVVLIVVARRARRQFPSCGACRYDLTGTIGEATRCPECGAEFVRVGILPPRRTSRPVTMTVGVVLIIAPLTCVGLWVATAAVGAAAAERSRAAAVQAQQQAIQAQLRATQTAPAQEQPEQPTAADADPTATATATDEASSGDDPNDDS
ncbi:MAG: hypothetical protein ACYTGG_11720 [Planctomycetota bacterium]|jgi:hypothetical protein